MLNRHYREELGNGLPCVLETQCIEINLTSGSTLLSEFVRFLRTEDVRMKATRIRICLKVDQCLSLSPSIPDFLVRAYMFDYQYHFS